MRRHAPHLLILLAGVAVWLWLQPSPAGRSFNRGVEAHRRGDWAEAERQFTLSLEDPTFPRRAEAFSMRGRMRAKLNRMVEAMADHNEAVALAPVNPMIRFARAEARDWLGDFRGAVEDYDAVLVADPNMAEAWFNRGSLRLALGLRTNAEADFAEAVRLNPELAERLAETKGKSP